MLSVERELSSLRERSLYRTLSVPEGIDFASNDYLGFSRNEKIREKIKAFLETESRLGSTGSRLISGHDEFVEETEHFIAELFGTECSLIFGSGYLANLGVTSAFGGNAEFFSDELNHASLIDGMRLSRAKIRVFRHNDPGHLESLLAQSKVQRKVIVTESIFSMDGDAAPVEVLERLAERFDALLILDEAHGTGTTGVNGLGAGHFFRSNHVISVHTCGKALGGYGAFVCCSRVLKEFFVNKARSFIFSTALPPLLIAHIRFALTELIQETAYFCQLIQNIEWTRTRFEDLGLPHSGSHIVPVVVGDCEKSLNLAENLKTRGIFAKAIRFPSVPKGSARLRLTLKSFHITSDLELLCEALKGALPEFQ